MQKASLVLITLLLSLFLFVGYFHEISAITQDLGRHIQTGEIILETTSVPKVNLFSYTHSNFPFINTHWFSEVIFFTVFRFGGYASLLWMTILTLFLACGLLYSLAAKRFSPIALSLVSLLYLRILFERTDIRPEIFSFLFVSLFILVLTKYQQTFTRWIFVLIPLQLLWVNIHIYFLIGLILIGIFLLDLFLVSFAKQLKKDHVFSFKTIQNLPKKISILSFVFILCIFTTLFNPHGVDGALYPFYVFDNYGYAIEENQTIFFLESLFYKPSLPFFKFSVLLLFFSLFLTLKKTRPSDWMLAVIFSYLGASAVRHFPLFVFTTFLPLTKSLSFIFLYIQDSYPIIKKYSPLFLLFISLLLIWQITVVYSMKPFGMSVPSGAKPAADFFLEKNISGPLFNNFDIGSYLDSRLYPKEKVFIDGRPEAYPASFFKDVYIPMQEDEKKFIEIEKKYKFNAIFFSHTDQTPWAQQFLQHITRNKTWKMIYLDDTIVIFVKDNEKNNPLIQSFSLDEENMGKHLPQDVNIRSYAHLAHFFSRIGWEKQEKDMYQKLLSIDKNFCPALYNLALLLQRQHDGSYLSYASRFQTTCQ